MLAASIHATRKKVVGVLCVIFAVLIAAILFFFGPEKGADDVRLLTEEDRQAYMASFGWETEAEPSEVKAIVVPSEDDALMQRYNEIQLGQGLDFTKYCGQEAIRYTYAVTNADDGGTRICLYVCDGVLAAADIASLEAGWQYGISGRAEAVASNRAESGASASTESGASVPVESGASAPTESGASMPEGSGAGIRAETTAFLLDGSETSASSGSGGCASGCACGVCCPGCVCGA